MTCVRIDDCNYWSEQHQALLVFCAKKAMRIFVIDNTVELDELISVGWIRTLRRRPSDRLKGCASFTISHMLDYLGYAVHGVSRYKYRKYGMPDMVRMDDGFDMPCDDWNPCDLAARRESEVLL
ncbi:MAG TPA: hypothetical protein VMW24_17370 [Sedimentisphaerales bacterium]|nr:hypothetical protein [Sedimentisphaerales bacterium]